MASPNHNIMGSGDRSPVRGKNHAHDWVVSVGKLSKKALPRADSHGDLFHLTAL